MPTGVYKRTEEHKRKLSETQKRIGNKPPLTRYWLGKKNDPRISNENHWHWSKNPSYTAIHKRVIKLFGKPDKCDDCGSIKSRIEWSNVSGKYLLIRSDWKKRCVKCHRKFDNHPFKKGMIGLRNGIKHTEETKQKLREIAKARNQFHGNGGRSILAKDLPTLGFPEVVSPSQK